MQLLTKDAKLHTSMGLSSSKTKDPTEHLQHRLERLSIILDDLREAVVELNEYAPTTFPPI